MAKSKIYAALSSIDLSKIKFLAEQSYTDNQLAEIFCVNNDTIQNWKKQFPCFFETLKKGKILADAKVEASLYQRACGYSHPDIVIKTVGGKVVKIPIIKHYPPDTTAIIFWLKNRKKEEWRDRQEIEHIINDYLHEDLKDVPTDRLRSFVEEINEN